MNPTTPTNIKRYGSITGLKEEKIARYKELHAAVWPGVLTTIKECNIRNYSIYIQKINNEYFLFSYFEYIGTNYDSDMKKMAADPVTQEWWQETAPLQIPLPDASTQESTWWNMEEVFHCD